MALGSLAWLKPAVFTGALVPLAAVAYRAASHGLGADPIAETINRLGLLALLFVVLTLACTPAKTLFGWTFPAKIRRMLGLFAFFYAALHVTSYALLDQRLALAAIGEDIVKRPFILVGFLAFMLLVPLAATSTKRMVQRLGFPRWKALHRLVYVIGLLGAVHFLWRVKKPTAEPLAYAAVVAALLAVRAATALRARLPRRRLLG
jgi:sulfoxide reductase heme-binding subunit YedZ